MEKSPSMRPRYRIASHIGELLDLAVARLAPEFDLSFFKLTEGTIGPLPDDVEIIFTSPLRKAGEPDVIMPAGWPYGVKWVQTLSAGVDAYPSWLFEGPRVTNASGSLAVPIAEFCMALILAAAKDLPDTWVHQREHWQMRGLSALENATLGIFGFGAIGEQIARRAQAFGMHVHAVRRSDAPLPEGIVRAESIDALAAISDHLVLAAPATAETRHIVSDNLLAKAKPGLHLINMARGSLVNDAAVLRALDSGSLSLVSLDATEPEPLPDGHPYYSHPKVRLSPHVSAITHGAIERIARMLAENLRRYSRGATLLNIVG